MNAPVFLSQERTGQAPALISVMPEEPVLPLSVEAYHALLQAGILQSGDAIELLEGFMVQRMGKGPRHERARRMLRRLLEKIISTEYFVDEQGAFTTADSEPEPDVFVIRGDVDDYADRHAVPTEVAILAEVSDSSIRRDRTWKKRIYARAGLGCYWIVNLIDNCIEVYTKPSDDKRQPGYAETVVYRAGDEVPVVLDGKEVGRIAAAAILGQPEEKK